MALRRWTGRAIALDVDGDFCRVAICQYGQVRSGAWVPSTPEGLKLLAESLMKSGRPARRAQPARLLWSGELGVGVDAR
jgi:hypothetical protein